MNADKRRSNKNILIGVHLRSSAANNVSAIARVQSARGIWPSRASTARCGAETLQKPREARKVYAVGQCLPSLPADVTRQLAFRSEVCAARDVPNRDHSELVSRQESSRRSGLLPISCKRAEMSGHAPRRRTEDENPLHVFPTTCAGRRRGFRASLDLAGRSARA